MNIYRQTIILFGFVAPLLVSVAVVGIGYKVKDKMTKSYASKKEEYKTHRLANISTMQVEKNVKELRTHDNRWDDQMSRETSSEVSIVLGKILEDLPNKEINRTSYEPSNKAGGFGNASTQASSQIQIAFRGTFRTLQKALLELETRLPQLQLEDLKMEPMQSNGYLITLQVKYTAWEK
jgi:hypothetical protein